MTGVSGVGIGVSGRRSIAYRALAAIRRNGGSAWWVPDSLTSSGIYTDSTGATPVSAVGDVLGLLTDRSYGAGNLGPELSPGTASIAGYTNNGFANITTSGTVLTVQNTGSVEGVASFGSVVAGKSYRFTITITSVFGSGRITIGGTTYTFGGAVGTYTAVLTAASSTNVAVASNNATVSGVIAFSSLSVREVLGNHATQATTANKPVITRVPRRLGPNLVVNGAFDSGSNWTFPGGAIGSGVATWSGTSADLSQPISVTVGRDYEVTFTMTAYSAGVGVGIHNGVGPFIRGSLVRRTAVGTYTEYLTATQPGSLTLNGAFAAGQGASIDNVSVREVLEWSNALKFDGSNDLLTLSSGAILSQASDHWVTAAFVLDTVGVEQCIYAATPTTGISRVAHLNITSANALRCLWIDGSSTIVTVSGSTLSAGVPYVATAAKIGGTYYLWLNGALVQSVAGTLGATTPTQANIGALSYTAAQFPFNGKLIDIYLGQSTLTDADRKTIERNMASRAGVTYLG